MKRGRRGRHRALAELLRPAERQLLAEMAADAIDIRLATVGVACPGCDRSPDLICGPHRAEVDQADRYRQLARALGADV